MGGQRGRRARRASNCEASGRSGIIWKHLDELGNAEAVAKLIVTDNLTRVFHSDPADVGTKRKHTDWLSRYVNQWMVDQGYSESMREVTTAAVQQFHKKNDSPLFGDFGVSRSSPEPATDPLEPVDVIESWA